MQVFIDQKTHINYSVIMREYSGLKELQKEDIKLKADYHSYAVTDKQDQIITRGNAQFEVFPRQTKQGMDIRDFIMRLKTNEWLKINDFDVVTELGGLIPVKLIPGNTVGVIRFAAYPPHAVALYFRISEVAEEKELFSYLDSPQPMESTIQPRKFKVLEVVLFMEIEQIEISTTGIFTGEKIFVGNFEREEVYRMNEYCISLKDISESHVNALKGKTVHITGILKVIKGKHNPTKTSTEGRIYEPYQEPDKKFISQPTFILNRPDN